MKRTPLARKTPLVARKGLRRGSPLRQIGRRAERDAAAATAFRAEVRRRYAGMCHGTPGCAPTLHFGAHAHHANRRRGRTPEQRHDPANGIYLCAAGHRWVHDHPAAATQLGLLHSSGRTR